MKFGIIGCNGRMGSALESIINDNKYDTCVYWFDKDYEKETDTPECLIDFSSRETLEFTLKKAWQFKCPVVIGTTGLREEDYSLLEKNSHTHAIMYNTNYSIGIYLLHRMLKTIQNNIEGWSVNISEIHHLGKKDRPSGTALSLSETLQIDVPIHSYRMKGVSGEHEVLLSNSAEILRLHHTTYSRSVFAQGAITCANWMKKNGVNAGLYSLEDMCEF